MDRLARLRVPLLRNVLGGLRLLAFLPVNASHFEVSARETLLFALLAALIWAAFDWLAVDGDAYFSWYGVAKLAWLTIIALALLVMLAPIRQGTAAFSRTATAVASVLPLAVGLTLVALHYAAETPFDTWIRFVLGALAVTYLYRAKRHIGGEPVMLAIAGALMTVLVTSWAYGQTVGARPELWYAESRFDEEIHQERYAAAEETLFRQAELIDRAVETLARGEPGRAELYFLGFAGYGEQSVFSKEAEFARAALSQRLDLDHRALVLANSPTPAADQPLASTAGLKRALRGIAGRMNLEEDVLFLFLTSHGEKNASLAVSQSVLPLADLRAADVAQALDEARITWRIVVISACYAGSFIEPLRNDWTLIITAARADRTSFGCTDTRELTYFGEALFRDALPRSNSLVEAADRARDIVTQQEKKEGLEPSEPQIYVGVRMREKLAELPLAPALSP